MIIYITIILAFVLIAAYKRNISSHSFNCVYDLYFSLFNLYFNRIYHSFGLPIYLNVVPTNLLPVFKLLIFSVVLLFLSQIIEDLLLDYEYTSLASLFTFTTKAILLIVWLNHMNNFMTSLYQFWDYSLEGMNSNGRNTYVFSATG